MVGFCFVLWGKAGCCLGLFCDTRGFIFCYIHLETYIPEVFGHLRKNYFRIKGMGEGGISIKNNLL